MSSPSQVAIPHQSSASVSLNANKTPNKVSKDDTFFLSSSFSFSFWTCSRCSFSDSEFGFLRGIFQGCELVWKAGISLGTALSAWPAHYWKTFKSCLKLQCIPDYNSMYFRIWTSGKATPGCKTAKKKGHNFTPKSHPTIYEFPVIIAIRNCGCFKASYTLLYEMAFNDALVYESRNICATGSTA